MSYDVVAVNIESRRVKIIAESKDERNAQAIIAMALARRGCDVEFFVEVPAGQYADGDVWKCAEREAG